MISMGIFLILSAELNIIEAHKIAAMFQFNKLSLSLEARRKLIRLEKS